MTHLVSLSFLVLACALVSRTLAAPLPQYVSNPPTGYNTYPDYRNGVQGYPNGRPTGYDTYPDYRSGVQGYPNGPAPGYAYGYGPPGGYTYGYGYGYPPAPPIGSGYGGAPMNPQGEDRTKDDEKGPTWNSIFKQGWENSKDHAENLNEGIKGRLSDWFDLNDKEKQSTSTQTQ